ncbi:MAG: hypothetical protein HY516_00515 [Candidatus Aenigmarchaeota archaeon]|nr:hypothetical protein [Candidatus Aenigmarchaeota archaeon]
MEKISLCQSCGNVAKLASCNNCYALVCSGCVFNQGCKLCMDGRKSKAPAGMSPARGF